MIILAAFAIGALVWLVIWTEVITPRRQRYQEQLARITQRDTDHDL